MNRPKKGDLLPEYEANISKSDFFVILASDEYFKDGRCFVHYTIANDHSIPFIIFHKKGYKFPDDFLSNIKASYSLHEYKNSCDLLKSMNNIFGKNASEINISTPFYE